jgi:hypothetical protein
LKIPKGKSESVNRTRTEDTMAKTKEKHKEQTTIYKTLHRKQDRITRTPLQTGGEFRFSELTCLTNFNTDILFSRLPRHRDLLMMPHKKKISFVVCYIISSGLCPKIMDKQVSKSILFYHHGDQPLLNNINID